MLRAAFRSMAQQANGENIYWNDMHDKSNMEDRGFLENELVKAKQEIRQLKEILVKHNIPFQSVMGSGSGSGGGGGGGDRENMDTCSLQNDARSMANMFPNQLREIQGLHNFMPASDQPTSVRQLPAFIPTQPTYNNLGFQTLYPQSSQFHPMQIHPHLQQHPQPLPSLSMMPNQYPTFGLPSYPVQQPAPVLPKKDRVPLFCTVCQRTVPYPYTEHLAGSAHFKKKKAAGLIDDTNVLVQVPATNSSSSETSDQSNLHRNTKSTATQPSTEQTSQNLGPDMEQKSDSGSIVPNQQNYFAVFSGREKNQSSDSGWDTKSSMQSENLLQQDSGSHFNETKNISATTSAATKQSFCEVCREYVDTSIPYKQHKLNPTHQAMMSMYSDAIDLVCNLCGTKRLTSKAVYLSHVTSDRHIRRELAEESLGKVQMSHPQWARTEVAKCRDRLMKQPESDDRIFDDPALH